MSPFELLAARVQVLEGRRGAFVTPVVPGVEVAEHFVEGRGNLGAHSTGQFGAGGAFAGEQLEEDHADGVEVARDAAALTVVEGSDGGLYLGVSSTFTTGTFFAGLIDDVRFYNRAITP